MANRRCAFLAIVITAYLFKKDVPTKSTLLATFFQVSGSFIAGYENLGTDAFGFGVVWLCNFMGAFAHVLIAHLNKEKVINAFDTCFFFSFVGLLVLAPYIVYSGNDKVLIDLIYTEG